MSRVQLNAEALKAIRERSGHSQLSLAQASGVSQGRISEIEACEGGVIGARPSTVKKLADALAVPIVALIAMPEIVVEAAAS